VKLPEATKLIKIRNTDQDTPRGTFLLTSLPRTGKTTLAACICEGLVGKDNTYLLDWPEEEGTSSLKGLGVSYSTVSTQAELDELYQVLVMAQPRAVIWDGLGSSYWALVKEKYPTMDLSGAMGANWQWAANKIRGELVRFKMIPSVEVFAATSLIWKDEDDFTGAKTRWQVVLPGQLKANIYGLFSYNILLKMAESGGQPVRVADLQPTATTVAGARAPFSMTIPKSVVYDLKNAKGVSPILEALGLKAKEG